MTGSALSPLEVLDAPGVEQTVWQLADRIALAQDRLDQVVLLGIYTRGVPLAHRLATRIQSITNQALAGVGALDITFFRDDLRTRGLRTPDRNEVPCDLTDQRVILVDDVIFRGRTIRAALEALHHFGRPEWVRLATLIDRGHREFPIQPDYLGQQLETTTADQVRVRLAEVDGQDQVLLERPVE